MKTKIFFKINKIPIFVVLVILILIIVAFRSYFVDYYSYSTSYYEIKEKCTNGKNDSKLCSSFRTNEDLERFLKNEDPKAKFLKLDAITLTCEVVENSIFSVLQWFSPLLIIIVVMGCFHSEISSGMFRNYLTRKTYRSFIIDKLKLVATVSFLFPCVLIAIFFIACIITRFNFRIDDYTTSLAVYHDFKYHHFFLYGLCICIVQYFISFSYGILGLLSSFRNKNLLVGIIMGYILFIIEELFISVGFYVFFLNKLLGFKELTEYFNIAGYWFFNQPMNYWLLLFISFIIAFIFLLMALFFLRNEERIVIDNEKQIA